MNVQPAALDGPNRQPQLAAGHGMVALTFAAGSSIYFASSADGGRTFSAPVKVAETKALAAGRHRGPRVAITQDAVVISAVTGDGKTAGFSDLVTWRSTDHGKTWSRGGTVNDEHRSAEEGLHAMAADAQGNLLAVWLDHRAGTKGKKLYGARSTDGGLTWSKNVLVYASPDGTICECCHPSLSVDERGQIWVMWRNALGGSRDFYVASTRDGVHFAEAQKLGAGTWKLDACPMDGGGLVSTGGQVISAWRRENGIFLASLGKAETQVGTGKDVAIAEGRDGVYVAWATGGGIQLWTPGATQAKSLAAQGAFVNLVGFEDGSVLAAWEANGTIRTERLDK
jgi:hypothetical protein